MTPPVAFYEERVKRMKPNDEPNEADKTMR